jgi:hypothetical protein
MAAGGSVWRAEGGRRSGFIGKAPGDAAVTTKMSSLHGRLDRRAYGGVPPTDRPVRGAHRPVQSGPRRARGWEDSQALGRGAWGRSTPRPACVLGRRVVRTPWPAGVQRGAAAFQS